MKKRATKVQVSVKDGDSTAQPSPRRRSTRGKKRKAEESIELSHFMDKKVRHTHSLSCTHADKTEITHRHMYTHTRHTGVAGKVEAVEAGQGRGSH